MHSIQEKSLHEKHICKQAVGCDIPLFLSGYNMRVPIATYKAFCLLHLGLQHILHRCWKYISRTFFFGELDDPIHFIVLDRMGCKSIGHSITYVINPYLFNSNALNAWSMKAPLQKYAQCM